MASDKAPWDLANEALYAGALRGALKAAADTEMELVELELQWAAVPVFDNGKPIADSKEPGTTPFRSRALYRVREPRLEDD